HNYEYSSCIQLRSPSRSTLFPYTTLFRSQQAGKGILVSHADPFRKGVADQQDAARRGFQRHVAGRSVPEAEAVGDQRVAHLAPEDRKSTRLNSSHLVISYAVFCLKKKRNI